VITSHEFLATWLRARFDDEKGASLVEYALLVALIAIICIGAITLIGSNASDKLSTAGNSLAN
jgi:pilus assembly protein Flp/PilA